MFSSTRLAVDISGMFSVTEKSLRSGFGITLFGSCLDEPVVDIRAFSTLGMNTFSIAFKTASCTQFLTAAIAPSISLLTWSEMFLSLTWFRPRWFVQDVASLITLAKLLYWVSTASPRAILNLVPWSTIKLFKISSKQLKSFFLFLIKLWHSTTWRLYRGAYYYNVENEKFDVFLTLFADVSHYSLNHRIILGKCFYIRFMNNLHVILYEFFIKKTIYAQLANLVMLATKFIDFD